MPATVLDIRNPNIVLPDFLVLDASIILRLIPTFTHQYRTETIRFLNRIQYAARTSQTLAILPYLALEECYFNICKAYLEARSGNTYWASYYDSNPHEISNIHPRLVRFRELLRTIPIEILEPEDLVTAHRQSLRLSDRMLTLINRFQLLPKDAAILAEAERAGIYTLASLDKDWTRADGFTVITVPP